MKLLKSKKLDLPTVYFITDRAEIKDVPIGIPFIFGDESVKKHMIKLLEYEILYQAAVDSGFPFNFKKILEDNGYKNIKSFSYGSPAYVEYSTSGTIKDDFDFEGCKPVITKSDSFKEYVKDASAYVDIEVLKKLKVFPTWLSNIEDAIHTNIHNFAVYNPDMYNKKLEGMYGGIDLKPPNKNLIIIDISGSIPRAVSTTCLTLAKNLSETFYADLLITGSKSTLYNYSELSELNIETIYDENGMDNDQVWFKKLLTDDERSYKTAIVFGDNDMPGQRWSNKFNDGAVNISDKDGKDLCKWKIENLISFHTGNRAWRDVYPKGKVPVAGYARWFEPEKTEKIENWVKYLNK